ncbi:hypothetical protein N7471_001294 [Penicillium samsonianum]|uniref:uncharacterized protein n=1 Tax=Penicillium samsonianum TaxID=1882272 RepID=UPI00254667BD|nr:uncharacterized protein N7471_001294 [Penicillium samsonianum]KAJ6150095.1 hypothetical protein N7471_001294 [Penicillium samsonianum]
MSSSASANFTTRWSPYHRPSPKSQIPKSRIPKNPIDGEKSAEEIALEEAGDLNALQRYRYEFHHGTTYEHQPPITQLLEAEEDFRHHFQLELSLRERSDQSEEVQEELRTQGKLLWMASREWWMLKNEFGGGVFLLKIVLQSKDVVLEIVGVVLTVQSIRRVVLELDIVLLRADVVSYYDYRGPRNSYARIELAAFWGLLADSCESPFDMIDESPVFPLFGSRKAESSSVDEEDNESTSTKDSESTLA